MEVICLEEEAFYALFKKVVTHVMQEQSDEPPPWISDQEAMKLLGIKSKTTLKKLRDEGKIRYSRHSRKIILYDRTSIEEYLNQHVRNTF